MINGFKIVDEHVHTFSSYEVASKIISSFNRTYDIEFENPGTGTIGNVLENMENTGIDCTIMANFAPPRILHDNNLWTIDISKRYGNLTALVSFHPEMEGNLGALLEQYIAKGAKGIKIHPMAQGFMPGDPGLDEVYEYCNEIVLPVVFHCGRVSNARLNEYADLEMILPVIDQYPNIPFVLTHMADGNIDDVIMLARNYLHVYFDSSIVITGYPPLLDVNEPSWVDDKTVIDVINMIGAERVMFGSDYPWGSPKHDLDRLVKMNLSEQQKRLILGENAVKIFKIK